MGYRQVAEILETDLGTSPTHRLVLLTMALLSDQEGKLKATEAKIGEACCLSGPTAGRALRALREANHLTSQEGGWWVVTPAGHDIRVMNGSPKKEKERTNLHVDAHEITRGVFASEHSPVQYTVVLKRVDTALKADWSREVVSLAGELTKYWTEAGWAEALQKAKSLLLVAENAPLLRGAVQFYNQNRDREQPSFDPETPLDHPIWLSLSNLLSRVGKERFKKAVYRFADDPVWNGKGNRPGDLGLLVNDKMNHRWMGEE